MEWAVIECQLKMELSREMMSKNVIDLDEIRSAFLQNLMASYDLFFELLYGHNCTLECVCRRISIEPFTGVSGEPLRPRV